MRAMALETLQKQVDEVRGLIAARLRIRGRDLDQQIRRAGRLLPAWARRDGRTMAQANLLAQNPKMLRMVDAAKFDKAYRALKTHLETIDPKEARKDRILGLLGVIYVNLFIALALLLGVLAWRGYL